MAVFHAQHTLTQGSLHYRLATLGYQNRNTYGVETYILHYGFYNFGSHMTSYSSLTCLPSFVPLATMRFNPG